MISALVKFCIQERIVVLVAALGLVAYGWYSYRNVPIDAIPNVSENQVIVITDWPGRSPKDIEDQITYPLSIKLQSVAGAESVRGKSMFGFSFIQVTFEDGVDFYWARSRVSEQLLTVGKDLPEGITPVLAPDATPLGQIYYYVLEAPYGMDLADLRSKQDFVIKYALQSVDGVAEVASIGGHVRQYQVEVDPDKLRIHELTLNQVIQAIRDSNIDVGAKTIESSGMEYVLRGVGFIGSGKTKAQTIEQIEKTVVMTKDTLPITIKDIASVQLGPAFRRGVLDWNGSETVGGVVVMSYGENPRQVIERVKEKIESLEKGLDGIRIHGVYDRTQLVEETVATLTEALAQEIAITIAVILLFLLHIRASLVVAITLPVAVLIAFIGMNQFGVDANIMSLAGIAIAIGTMVDMGIIISENVFRGIADWEKNGRPGGEAGRVNAIQRMTGEVAPAVITAVSTTIISFLPVFFLTGRDYRLFTPLAWTKTYSLVASLLVAVLLVPPLARLLLKSPQNKGWFATIAAIGFGGIIAALCTFVWRPRIELIAAWFNTRYENWSGSALGMTGIELTILISLLAAGIMYKLFREKLRPVDENIVARLVNFIYEPVLRIFLQFKKTFLAVPLIIVFFGLGAWLGFHNLLSRIDKFAKEELGADLNGSQAYVDFKHTFTGLKSDDWIALDEGSWFYMPSLYPAASLSKSMETLQTQDAMIKEIPEVADVLGKIGRVDSALDPAPIGMIETYVMLKPKDQWRAGMTEKKIWDEINELATLPGLTKAAQLQPIEGRVVMLQSGITASMAVRLYGNSLEDLAVVARQVAEKLKLHPMVEKGTVSSGIVFGKSYVEFEVDRSESARYGMRVKEVNQMIEAALGGKVATRTVEGRERYGIQVRYQGSYRDKIEELKKVPVVTNTGAVVPLGRLTHIDTSWGPHVITSENARLASTVSFAPKDNHDRMKVVESVMRSLDNARTMNQFDLPEGISWEPVGMFEEQVKSNQRLMWLAPLLDIPMPDEIETTEDRMRWLAWWTPLGLIPIALLISICIIYLQFRKIPLTLAVFTGIPVAFGGGMIALAIAEVELTTAVWVGFIALFGIAIDDGVVIATYLNQAINRAQPNTVREIRSAVVEAGLRRIRPCLMTTMTTVLALLPVLYSTGRGADVARAMAIPVFGGMLFELITLFVVPVVYCWMLEFKLRAGIVNSDVHQHEASSPLEPEIS